MGRFCKKLAKAKDYYCLIAFAGDPIGKLGSVFLVKRIIQ